MGGCIFMPGEPTEYPPVPIAGPNYKVRATFASGAKCEPERIGGSLWRLRCHTVTRSNDGKELVATELPDELKLTWQEPQAISGSAFARPPVCTVYDGGLAQDCEVDLEQPLLETTVLTELKLKFLPTGVERSAVDRSTIGTEAESYGVHPFATIKLQPQLPSTTELASSPFPFGFQAHWTSPEKMRGEPGQMCAWGNRIYFVINLSLIYVYDPDEGVRFFAGSMANGEDTDITHPHKIGLLSGGIACAKRGVYVADRTRVLLIGHDGTVTVLVSGLPYDDVWTGAQGVAARDDGTVLFGYRENIYNSEGLVSNQTLSIRRREPSGEIRTVAGGTAGNWGYGGDGGPALDAKLANTNWLLFGAADDFYIADWGNYRIRHVDRNGIIRTFAGTGSPAPAHNQPPAGDGGPAASADITPKMLTRGKDGSLLFVDGNYQYRGIRVRRISPQGILSTLAGKPFEANDPDPDNAPALQSKLSRVSGLAVTQDGKFAVSDGLRIRKLQKDGTLKTVVGSHTRQQVSESGGDGGPAAEATFYHLGAVAIAPDGNLYFTDGYDNRVRRIDPQGIVHPFAGNGLPYFSGDGGPATQAGMQGPNALLVANGALYIGHHARIRKVDLSTGIITTVAGNGQITGGGDGGPATSASLNSVRGMAMGPDGSLYFSDGWHARIRRIDPAGIITTVAGNGTSGYSGDGGPATLASIQSGQSIAVSQDGELFIGGNARLRKVDSSGIITTFLGNGNTSAPTPAEGAWMSESPFPYASFVRDGTGRYYARHGSGIQVISPEVRPDTGTIDYRVSNLVAADRFVECGSGNVKTKADVKTTLASMCTGTIVSLDVAVVTRNGMPQRMFVFRQYLRSSNAILETAQNFGNIVATWSPLE